MEKKGAYVLTSLLKNKILPKSKHAQVTIFIIIAIFIVAAGVLIYLFFPQIRSSLGGGIKDPQGFIQGCVEEEIEDAVEMVSLQGGSIEPEHYITYDDLPVEYLCYTNEYYKTCSVQQPMLKEHIESEIKIEIEDVVIACFNSLEENYKNRGYTVNMDPVVTKIELLPKRVVATFDTEITLTKGDVETYDSFRVILNNNLYELVGITQSILEWETTLGNSNPDVYMTIYPDLKVEQDYMSDGTKVYILTDKNNGNEFKFASRSLVFPPGI